MKSSSQDEVLISDLLMWCVENPENPENQMMIWCTRNQEIYMMIVVGGVRRCSTGCKKLIRNEENGV
jgi:hypothetical protein